MKTLKQLLIWEKKLSRTKRSIRIIKCQRSDTEKKNNLIKEGKRKGIDEIIRQNA